jgi:hypothetical protein
LEQEADCLLRIFGRGSAHAIELAAQPPQFSLQRGREQVALAAEAAIEGGFIDPGAPRDRARAGAAEPELGEDIDGGIQDASFRGRAFCTGVRQSAPALG